MKKRQTLVQLTFKLTPHTAIDVFDSSFKYEDVKFFIELIPDLILRNNYSELNQKDFLNLEWLIKTMTTLIDSAKMTDLLQKFNLTKYIIIEPDNPIINTVNIANRSEILSDQMLDWLNSSSAHRKRKIYTIDEMRDFFISEFFFNEFLKWLEQIVTNKNITLVELLVAYYNWFPYKPRFKEAT